jgi:hypothetical protein
VGGAAEEEQREEQKEKNRMMEGRRRGQRRRRHHSRHLVEGVCCSTSWRLLTQLRPIAILARSVSSVESTLFDTKRRGSSLPDRGVAN